MTGFQLGLNQKFDTEEDINDKLVDLKNGVTVANFGGNSYGIGACKELPLNLRKLKH